MVVAEALLPCSLPNHSSEITMKSLTIFKSALTACIIATSTIVFTVSSASAGDHGKKEKHYAAEKDIIDTAIAAGSFNTLAAALTKAELIDTLKGDGPFTVFAPTDEAFAKVPESDLKALLADKEKLKAVLTYHVIAGKVMAADVIELSTATTVQGSNLAIIAEESVTINGAKVLKTDVKASNGVIHVIDSVLIP